MSFAQQKWERRFAQMGDEAEAAFERTYERGYTRYGLKRPDVQVGKLPLVVRYTPDYLTTDSFIECKGVGKDGILKLKLDQLFALQWWDAIQAVDVFIWDSYRKRYATISLGELRRAAETHGSLGQFPEGKPIWQISVDLITQEWVDDST